MIGFIIACTLVAVFILSHFPPEEGSSRRKEKAEGVFFGEPQ